MNTDAYGSRRPRMRVSGIHLLTGLALAAVAVWVLVAGFPVHVASTPEVDLPTSTAGAPVPGDVLEVALRADGACAITLPTSGLVSRAPSAVELSGVVRAALQARPGAPVALRIDRETPWATVSVVLDVLREEGAGAVYFETRRSVVTRGAG